MNRTIKFRGKRITDGEWLYGYYFVNRGEHFIVKDELAPTGNTFLDYEVDSETVGQFTGKKDKNGKEIYEHDIIQHKGQNYLVKFLAGMFYGSAEECNKGIYGGFPLWSLVDMGCKIIGNKFDNPELLK